MGPTFIEEFKFLVKKIFLTKIKRIASERNFHLFRLFEISNLKLNFQRSKKDDSALDLTIPWECGRPVYQSHFGNRFTKIGNQVTKIGDF